MLFPILGALHGSSHLIISKQTNKQTCEGAIFINLNAVMRTRGRGSSDNLPKVTQSLHRGWSWNSHAGGLAPAPMFFSTTSQMP